MNEFNVDLRPFPFEQMVPAGRYRYTVRANWKTTMNAFQESYHGAFVHKRSVPQAFADGGDPYLAAQRIKLQDNGNQSISVHFPAHEPTPAEALAFRFGATFTQGGAGQAAGFPGTAQAEVRDWAFDLNGFSRVRGSTLAPGGTTSTHSGRWRRTVRCTNWRTTSRCPSARPA